MKKKNAFSKVVVALIVLLYVVFSGAVLFVYWHTGSEPVALVGAWFAFTTGELFMVAKIKRTKIEKGDGSNDRLEAEVDESEVLGGGSGVRDTGPDRAECIEPDR
jgi:hypothetical protein